ncbi:O-antigen/teichoic acid export membrane protein [Chromobacterium alkanivorans]|uniref:lipopolysaccharide biosynthesis protein n=1 Tax=Chromobacterium alkanivorans TaxID=1071719 RepID=UPI0021686042|nr:hypothetical protein [Chromobacterium alkanivorans]MCS3802728.1 O-antigen/teichoic acid export membrane protein [Chromobacterium alkanivorans]MCS3817054.1 O-antigen/teichoic acid export membrane protein [Chromobacterium alkanivorans]MCS3872094.1 O-antigen/teichoic acid export membrane protein [Chromobacterium alkanivorans]
MSNKDALNAIFGSGFSRGYVLGSELLLLLITTTWMTPSDRGVYIAGFALLKTVTIICSLSFGQIAIHHISEKHHSSVGGVGASLLIGCILFPAVALLGLYAYGSISDEFRRTYVSPFLTLLAIGLPIFVLEVYFYAFLTALGRLNTGNAAIVVGKTLAWGCVLILGLVKGGLNANEVLASLLSGQLVIVLGYSLGVISEFRQRAIHLVIEWKTFLGMLRKSIRLHPSIIGSIIFGGIDVLIAFKLAGAKSASEYQIAMQLLSALSILPFAIAQFGYKLVSQLGARNAWLRFQAILYKTFSLHCVLAVFSVGLVWVAAHYLFNEQYINVSTLYMLLIAGAPGLFFSLVMAPFWIGFGYFSTTSMLTIATGALMLPLSYAMTMHYDVKGTAITFIIGQVLSVVINGLFIKHLRRTHHV